MNGTIMFTLKMQDMMSSGLMKLASNSNTVFNKITNHTKQLSDKNKVLGMSYNELQNKIQQVEARIKNSTIPSQIAEARRELAALQRLSAGHAGNLQGGASGSSGIGVGGVAIGSMLGGFAMQAGSAIIGAVGSGVSAMITKSMEKEQAITGLTTFLGKQGATEAYNNIRQDADVTPFDTTSLLEVNRALISAGSNAKDARFDAMNLANAVSAVGGGNDVLSRMAANMQQIKTVGKATAMDIKQFGIAGINIYEMLHRSTGKSIEQVKEMDVSYADLSKAMAMANSKGGIYDGAMNAQSQTMSGKWSTVQDKLGNAASDIGDAFSPVFNKLLDLGVKFAESIGPMLQRAKPYIDAISNGIGKAVDYVTQLKSGTGGWSDYLAIAQNYVSVIWNFVKETAIQAWTLVSSILEFIKNSEILKDVFRFIVWILERAYNIISWLFDKIIWLWKNVLEPIIEKIDWAYKTIKDAFGSEKTIKIAATKKIIHSKKPDDNPSNSPLGSGAAMMASNSAAGKLAGDTVSGAGPKVVNIHVGKFFDNLQFTTLNTGESADEIEKIVMECFARVVYNGSKLV